MKGNLQHFLLAGISQRVAVDSVLNRFDIPGRTTRIERYSDMLIRDYISAPSYEIKNQSERMSQYYRLFYLLENEIRSFIVDMLASNGESDWWIKKSARGRKAKC